VSDPGSAAALVAGPTDLAARLVAELTRRGQTVATCESITGGLIGASLTEPPGASLAVRGGLVTYMTDLKTTLAGIPADLIAVHGVVSEAVAAAMAQAARRVCRADWGIGVTGVAGPGPAEGQPAGTVWLAVAGPTALSARSLHLAGSRRQVRRAVAFQALVDLERALALAADPA
jgi:nicotinamide-nucleotide amidase